MKRPNFLFILTDDQSFWALGKETSAIISPNLDEMANKGAYFKNFFCASPVCSPARASILTGLMPSSHGIQDWLISGNVNICDMPTNVRDRAPFKQNENVKCDFLEGIETYTDLLADNGYNIALSGKWHLGDTLKKRKGYTYWNSILRGGCSYRSYDMFCDGEIHSKEIYLTDEITNNALDFIDAYEENQPFYLGVHYTAPHTPWDKKEHKEEIWKLYDNLDFNCLPNEKIHKNQVLHKYIGDTKEKREEWIKGYFSAITAVDFGVKKLLDKLKQRNMLEDTVVIFTGDNGMNLGQHGVWGKGNGTYPQNMYEESIKVPFFMYNEKRISPKEVENLCSHVDIFPTICDFAGIECDENEKRWGMSLFSKKEQEHLFIFDEYGIVRMVRTKDFKLVADSKLEKFELFDLKKDPKERKNVFGQKDYLLKSEELKNVLENEFVKLTTEKIDGRKFANQGLGQKKFPHEEGAFVQGQSFYYEDK